MKKFLTFLFLGAVMTVSATNIYPGAEKIEFVKQENVTDKTEEAEKENPHRLFFFAVGRKQPCRLV